MNDAKYREVLSIHNQHQRRIHQIGREFRIEQYLLSGQNFWWYRMPVDYEG